MATLGLILWEILPERLKLQRDDTDAESGMEIVLGFLALYIGEGAALAAALQGTARRVVVEQNGTVTWQVERTATEEIAHYPILAVYGVATLITLTAVIWMYLAMKTVNGNPRPYFDRSSRKMLAFVLAVGVIGAVGLTFAAQKGLLPGQLKTVSRETLSREIDGSKEGLAWNYEFTVDDAAAIAGDRQVFDVSLSPSLWEVMYIRDIKGLHFDPEKQEWADGPHPATNRADTERARAERTRRATWRYLKPGRYAAQIVLRAREPRTFNFKAMEQQLDQDGSPHRVFVKRAENVEK